MAVNWIATCESIVHVRCGPIMGSAVRNFAPKSHNIPKPKSNIAQMRNIIVNC